MSEVRISVQLAVWLVVLLVGCVNPPPLELDPSAARPFAPSPSLLHGFDTLAPEPWIRQGDQMLLGVRLREPGQTKEWYLSFEVLGDVATLDGEIVHMHASFSGGPLGPIGPVDSILVPVSLKLIDADGVTLAQSEVLFPGFLQNGFHEICRVSRRGDPDRWTQEEAERYLGGYSCRRSLFTLLQREPLLADILWEVVDYPSLWSLVTGFGLKLSLSTPFEHSMSSEARYGDRSYPAESFAFAIKGNGDVLFAGEILAIEPRSPATLSGGVMQVLGYQPSKPERRFELSVLAARRGPKVGPAFALTPGGGIRPFGDYVRYDSSADFSFYLKGW